MKYYIVFFASGSKGNEVRANGDGGFLRRGYYFRDRDGMQGPFVNLRIAQRICDDAVLSNPKASVQHANYGLAS